MSWTQEQRDAQSARVRAQWADPAIRAKRVAGCRKAVSDPEVKARQKAGMVGNKNGRGNRGKVQSEEQKAEHAARMTGRVQSPEVIAKRMEGNRIAWAAKTPEEIAAWRENQQRSIYKPTNIERQTHEILDELGIVFVIHPWVRVLVDGALRPLRPDVLIPSQNLIIEVNGCYWHGCTNCYGDKARIDRVEEDVMRQMLFEEQGYHVLFLWEHDLKADLGLEIIQASIGSV